MSVCSVDIVDDPRYDSTLSPLSVVVSRSPVNIAFSRKKILKLLNLPYQTTWEEANKVLKAKIVAARKKNDDESAVRYSQMRDVLEKKLAHYCSCGTLIAKESNQCAVCQNQIGDIHDSLQYFVGKYSDHHLSRVYNLPRIKITKYRNKLGIKPYDCFAGDSYVPPRRSLPEAVLEKLGKMADSAIAKLYHVSHFSVADERRKRGIPAFGKLPEPFPFPPEAIAMFGKTSDEKIAKEFGCSEYAVWYKRKKLRIPAYERLRISKYWSPILIDLLGKQSDGSIAKKFGLRQNAVFRERVRRGIPVYKRENSERNNSGSSSVSS